MPSLPCPNPSPGSDALWVIVEHAMREYEEGVIDVRGAVLHAAAHGWCRVGGVPGVVREHIG
jgi:hypothetical protein